MRIRYKLFAALTAVFLLPIALLFSVRIPRPAEWARPLLWVGVVFCILAMLWISWKITQIFFGPLEEFKKALDRLTKGELNVKLTPPRDDEWRAVADSFSRMVRKLENTAATRQEIDRTLSDMEKFNRMALGREMRVIELKREINRLHLEAGKKPPYDLSFAQETYLSAPDGS
jgi:methyl-accepting chemotaxis protein